MLTFRTIPTSLSRRRLTISLLIAASVTCAIIGIVILRSVTADQALAAVRPAGLAAAAARKLPAINVDSLFAAKADEPTPIDSSFTLPVSPQNTITGHISWYGPGFNGRKTANGEIFNKSQLTCAHKSLPFGTLVRVSDKQNGRSVLVRVNDRGPYVGSRVLDLSEEAARQMKLFGKGTTTARLEIFPPSSLNAVSFDNDWHAVKIHGFTVVTAETPSFEKAVVMAQTLRGMGREEQVYLTQARSGKKTVYRISVGLFDSEGSANGVRAELLNKYSAAQVLKFGAGNKSEPDVAVAVPACTTQAGGE